MKNLALDTIKINRKYIIGMLMFILLTFLLGSCKKFLDEKPDKKLAVPSTLADYQALLDNYTVMYAVPSAAEISADDYYLTATDWGNIKIENYKNMYVWAGENLFGANEAQNDWKLVYTTIYHSNTVLNGIENANLQDPKWRDLKGQALFFRASALLDAVNIWSPAFDQATANTDLGVPLRSTINFNETPVRANVADTYNYIINDLKYASRVLTGSPLSKWRASKPAALGMLARTYLAMRDYPNALLYADSCLQFNAALMDYNTLNTTVNYPILLNNEEVIFNKMLYQREPLNIAIHKVLPDLYNTYGDTDLRKEVFFRKNTDNSYRFRGSYAQNQGLFTGIATNEMYMIKAECLVRANRFTEGIMQLNTLLKTRYTKVGGLSTFIPYQVNNEKDALTIVLMERRKELLMRNLRWQDIKRLNKEGANIALERNINGTLYKLPANDLRFALPLPEDVIAFSGMPQNPK